MAKDLTELIKAAKAIVLQRLWEVGIEDHFVVKIKTLRKPEWLGLYRSMSQFKSKPIFWINDSIVKNAEVEGENPIDVIVDTIHHEYGHTIYEYSLMASWPARENNPKLLNLIWTHYAHEQEEDFAEDFSHFMNDDGTVDEKFFQQVVDVFRAAAFETAVAA